MDRVEREVNNYLTKKINATIDIRFVDYADFTKVMNNKTDEGEIFDLVFTSSWANDYYPNAKEGDFLNLNNLIKEYGKDVYKALDKKFWEGAAIDGCIYAIPNQKEISSMPMWVFSKEYVEKYNIPYKDIKTLEDLEPWLKLIKENEEGGNSFLRLMMVIQFLCFGYQLAPALGINLESNNFKVVNIFKTEEMINNLKTIEKI